MRTFVAFTLPDETANQIVQWQQENMPLNVYPEPATNLHMTLAFLGDTPDELVPQINAILQQLNPAQVVIDGPIEYREQEKLAFLVYNEQGGNAIWDELNRQLLELTGYKPQFSPWLPHTTIWRYGAENKPNINPPLPSISFSPTAVTLYQSVKNPAGGGTYQKVGNILDPIQGELDRRVFRGNQPRPAVVNFIKRLYSRAFSHEFGVPLEAVPHFVNLVLTGSLTTYQFSDTSDCDVSVFVNWKYIEHQLGLDPKQARRDLIAMGIDRLDGTFLPGGSHPLQFFVISEGIEPQDLYQPGLRSGYDLGSRQWLVEPERSRVHDIALEFPDVYQRASEIGEKMKIMLDSDDAEMAKELWKQIHEKRMLDQQAGLGDFCEGNIVYKWLVHEGLVDRLRKELRLQISTKVAVDWSGDELDPRAIDNRDGGMEVWDRLNHQVAQLASKYDTRIQYLPRDKLESSNSWLTYDSTDDLGNPDWNNVVFQTYAAFPYITGERSYFAALHEIGHTAFKRVYNQPFNDNSQEEELWAWHFALENSQMTFSEDTLEWAKKLFSSYDHPWTSIESPTYPGWLNTYDHTQMNQERAQGETKPMNPAYPWYSKTATYPFIDPEDAYFHDIEDNPVRLHEYWRTFWINPAEELYQNGDHMYVDVLANPDEVQTGDPVTVKWESPNGRKKVDGVLEYVPDADAMNQGATAVIRIDTDSMTDMVYAKTAAMMKIIYDFEKDRIILGSEASNTKTVMIGEYDEEAKSATLYEAERNWINPTYFRRLWNYSYPHRPLKEVHYQRGDNKRKLKTKDHPHHERHVRSMAERSGDPTLDAAIEEFLVREVQVPRDYKSPGDWVDFQTHPVEKFKDPELSFGYCNVLAASFRDFLKKKNIESAIEWYDNVKGLYSDLETRDQDSNFAPGWPGPVKQFPLDALDHCVTIVKLNGSTYSVDFTPAQYGYGEFPLVQKLDSGGWQRQWNVDESSATD